MANNCTATSSDGTYTVNVVMDKDPNGLYFVELDITTFAASDIINVRVNGQAVWEGYAAEATGG